MKNYFYYDEKECKFIPVRYNTTDRLIYTASLWILCGVVLTGLSMIFLSNVAGTPSEIALRAENKELAKQLRYTHSTITHLDTQLQLLAENDNELYRTVLGVDPIPYEERQLGVGGSDPLEGFDAFQPHTSELLRWTISNVESLERRVGIQKVSFEEIKEYYNENQQKLRNLPITRPVDGVILSGFGMRMHPALRYRRHHDGVDFRARIGTPIYATGDGVVKFSGRRGTYGLLLEIDHGFGYETRFAHLSRFEDGIRPGTRVRRGQIVGYTGDTGITTGPHLHYEIRKHGRAVNPENYMFADLTPEEYREFRRISEATTISSSE